MSRRNKRKVSTAKQLVRIKPSRQSKITTPRIKPIEQRAYEATSIGRRLGKWDAPATSATNAVTTELELLQKRQQSLVRNNGWVANALQFHVTSEVGTGIKPRPSTIDNEFNKELLELWEDYNQFADATGNLGVYGIQAQAVRARMESGECFILIHRQRSNRNIPVPVQFQVIESQMCPSWYNKEAFEGGNRIVSGVEVNKHGRPVAYWFHKTDPNELITVKNSYDLMRVKVDDVIHHFIPLRPGQLRGVPLGVQASVQAYIFDQYTDSELQRKQNRANFTGIVKRPDYGEVDYKYDPISGMALKEDDEGNPMTEIEPGSFPSLLPGEELMLFDADVATGGAYHEYQKNQLLAICAGLQIPVQFATGDFTEINDRIYRAILNNYKRQIEQLQHTYTIAQICRKMWSEFVDRAIMSGEVKSPKIESNFGQYRCKHRGQAFAHIHPVQDIQANALDLAEGFTSRQKIVDNRNNGDTIEEIDRQRKEDNDREKKLGLQTDPVEILDNDEEDNKDESDKKTK